MAVGDAADMAARLKSALPAGWFASTPDGEASNTPVLDGVLSGIGSIYATSYSLLAYVKLQTRIMTATGAFLDIIASDFFGPVIFRRPNEEDASLRARIKLELFRKKVTRAAVSSSMADLTGNVPSIVEPWNPQDCGGYGIARGYNVAGCYGSLQMPFQFFITIERPSGLGVPGLMGYGNIGAGVPSAIGGYGVGAMAYASAAQIEAPVTDDEILSRLNDVRPAASIAWANLVSG